MAKKRQKNGVAWWGLMAPGTGWLGAMGVRGSRGHGQRWMSVLESFPALTQAVVIPSWQKVGAGSLSLFQVCRAPPYLGPGSGSS